MENSIHIVFNKQLFSDLQKDYPTVLFPFKLSTGPFLLTKERIKDIEVEIYKENENEILNFYNAFLNFDFSWRNIVIWYSDECNDFCNYLYLINYLHTLDVNLYYVNCSEMLTYDDVCIKQNNSSSMSKEIVDMLIKKQHKIDEKELQHILSFYQKDLGEEQRLWKIGRFIHFKFKTIDSIVAELVENNFKTSAEVCFACHMLLELEFPGEVLNYRLSTL